MHLESLINDIGGFGRFQMCLMPMLALFKSLTVLTMLVMIFAGKEPEWRCQSSDNSSTSVIDEGDLCNVNHTCIRVYDTSMRTIVSEWDLVCERKWMVNTIISIQMAGVLVGAIICGYCSDTYGRKKTLYLGILGAAIGNLVAAFSVSVLMFTIMRFFLGAFIGLSLPVVYLYMVEFVGTKWRGFIASLPSWTFGVLILSVVTWAIKDWMWIHIATTCIYTAFLFTWWIVPESLRWLAVKGHLKEARRVVNQMATLNRRPIPEMEILEAIAKEEMAAGNKAKNYSYLDLVKTKKTLRKTIFTCFIWFSLALIYYTISFGVRSLSGDFYTNFVVMAAIELPSTFLVIFVVYLFQRRTAAAIFFVCTTCCLVGFAITTRIAPKEIKGSLENGLALTARFFGTSAWSVSMAMTSEQFPTVIRNLAFASQNTSARIGSILAAQLLSLGNKNDLMPPYVAMAILTILTALACFTLEETGKKALEDTMGDYTRVVLKMPPVDQVKDPPFAKNGDVKDPPFVKDGEVADMDKKPLLNGLRVKSEDHVDWTCEENQKCPTLHTKDDEIVTNDKKPIVQDIDEKHEKQ